MSSRDRLLIRLGATSAAGYLALAFAGDLKTRPALYLSIHAILFILYLVGIRAVMRAHHGDDSARQGAAVILCAVVFRVLLLPAAPSLSDDIWRYVWEGRVQLHGINPYRYVPSAPELAPYRDDAYAGVNYKDLPAIYPPAMQWCFALGALMGGSAAAMKSIFIAADIVLIFLLSRLLGVLGLPTSRVIIYAWNPLAVIEVAGSGHNDSLAVCLLVASVLALAGRRRVASMAALSLAALSKLFPIALLPLYAKRVRPAHLVLVTAMTAACYLPYLSAGANLFRSAREYAERWRFNDPIFWAIEASVDASGVSPVAKSWADTRGLDSLYTQPHMIARGLAALLALATLGWLAATLDPSKSIALPRSIYLFTGLVLLLQPALHPWYLLWLLPWLAVFPSPAWLALSGLLPLAYFAWPWVWWVEFAPFFILLALGWIAARRGGSLWRGSSRLW